MKTKHTPGPWAVTPAWSKSKLNVRGPSGNTLAEIIKEKHPYEDNARLIAAAPELLKALECARIYLSACKKETFPPGLIEDVESAIAKATGGDE